MTESNTGAIPRTDRESVIYEHLALDGARVIDIGCGEGWLTRLVAPHTGTVIGIDPSPTALERATATSNAINVNYLLASADKLPLNHGSADIAIYYNSLHHVPAALQSRAMAETARVLVPGGILCIVEPLARGQAYELFQPVEDESNFYNATYRLILEVASAGGFQQLLEKPFVDFYTYLNFEQFIDSVLIVDARRVHALDGIKDMLRERFKRLGEAVEGGRRYDQFHRLNLLRKL